MKTDKPKLTNYNHLIDEDRNFLLLKLLNRIEILEFEIKKLKNIKLNEN